MAKSGYGHRIFCTYIDITICRSDCIAGDHHTFQQFVRVTFHNGTIHKRSRVTFIAVTYDITYFFFLTCHLFPFTAGRETAAASAAQSGFIDLFNYFFACHLKHRFLQSRKTAGSHILVNGFCIKTSTVLQNDPGLFCDKRDLFRMTVNFFLFAV